MTPLLEVSDLKVHFPFGGGLIRAPRGLVRAVDGVSLTIEPGEVVALVGESGCGKTTVARAILGLLPVTGGRILLRGREIPGLSPGSRGDGAERLAYRRSIQMVFQDPFDSLNPRKTVFQILAQPLRIHRIVPDEGLRAEAVRLLDLVGLNPGAAYLDRYPHQFSGGQRQRICIARSIAVRPEIIVADEAVSALDISIRAQILSLLRRLQRDLNLSYLFITHDLGVVRSLCDRVLVMYVGQVVERGSTEQVFTLPRHPYTRALLAASPLPDPAKARARQHLILQGDVPSPAHPPAGCRFHPRCPVARPVCATELPAAHGIAAGHDSFCHFAEEAEGWVFGRTPSMETAP